MANTKPVGEIIIDTIIRSKAITHAEITDTGTVFVWAANSPEQIEAALQEAGYCIKEIEK